MLKVQTVDIKKAGNSEVVPVVDERLESAEFQALWERIRHRTQFQVTIDESTLRAAVVDAIRSQPPVPERTGRWHTTVVEDIDQGGLRTATIRSERVDVTYADSEDLPDILSILADRTQLTRRTLAEALTESGTLPQFRKNPQVYVDQATRAIKAAKETLQSRGLRYELVAATRPEPARRFPISMIKAADLAGYTGPGGNMITDPDTGELVEFDVKSPYRYLVVDSKVEETLALHLKSRVDVKVFVKLPRAFTIPTPLGDYNPDWAVVYERPDGSRYLVLETKSSLDPELLRPEERGKIAAATRHFATVQQEVGLTDLAYGVVDGIDAANTVVDEAFGRPPS